MVSVKSLGPWISPWQRDAEKLPSENKVPTILANRNTIIPKNLN